MKTFLDAVAEHWIITIMLLAFLYFTIEMICTAIVVNTRHKSKYYTPKRKKNATTSKTN